MATKKMLIDATHPEETRVVVINGNVLEDFDVEVESRKQLRGNIYLAKVTRVEPSLQAAFVDYGGNRHGFLSFNEIHPDYYQIPIADRQQLVAEQDAQEIDDEDGEPAGAGGDDASSVETVGGDDTEEVEARRPRPSPRHYKIQEVVKRRQVLLIQVVKEERGNKGAALTTYISLAGRYCVLMPNTAHGGGISRKILNGADRKNLKTMLGGFGIPEGMAVIVRTAGAKRSKPEIKRDYEYLLRLWGSVRELTLESSAPCLIHEEGNLIKRSIRDIYNSEIGEIIVDGAEGYRTAKDFMKLLIPSHAKRVQPYQNTGTPITRHFNIEGQLDAMHSPLVKLKSGGYIVINPTEALVSIDVNSGKATRARSIEETALKTNLEASDEIARQVRLRDLAGLIVIDFIDMEVGRNNTRVERQLKEAMRTDRARIQLGRISPFGLLEMSRQRLRPSLIETITEPCPHCSGTGVRRSTESAALFVLRAIEEKATRSGAAEYTVHVPTEVALYILNFKHPSLAEIETRNRVSIILSSDDSLIPPDHRIEKISGKAEPRGAKAAKTAARDEAAETAPAAAQSPPADDEEAPKRRRRRSRRRKSAAADERRPAAEAADASQEAPDERPGQSAEAGETAGQAGERADGAPAKRRRRGRRGGRRRARKTPEQQRMEGAGKDRDAAEEVILLPGPEQAAPLASPAEPVMVVGTDGTAVPTLDDDAGKADGGEIPAASGKPAAKRKDSAAKTPSRRRATRKKAAAEAGSEPVAAAPEGGAEKEKPKPRRRRKAKPADDAAAAETGKSTAIDPHLAESGKSPQKKGWWQRL